MLKRGLNFCSRWIKDALRYRKKYMVVAVVLFLMEIALFLWPVGWMEEDIYSGLTGEGSYGLEFYEDNRSITQEFRPQYSHLKSIDIVLESEKEELSEGSAMFILSDERNEVLFEKALEYDEIDLNRYAVIEVNQQLDTRQIYYITVVVGEDSNGTVPRLWVCNAKDYPLKENGALYQSDELEDTQLVTRYQYENVITREKALRVVVLALVTALIIAFGLPENVLLRNLVGGVLLLALPYVLGQRLELLSINTSMLLPFAMKWNMIIMYVIELVLFLLTFSVRFTVLCSTIGLTLLYTVNYFVWTYRGMPFKFRELSAAGTAMQVIGEYDLRPGTHLSMALCLAILFAAFAAQTGWRKLWHRRENGQSGKKYLVFRGTLVLMGVLLAGCTSYMALCTDYFTNKGFVNSKGRDAHLIYHVNGFLVSTCIDFQNPVAAEPEGYSVEKVEEILKNNPENGVIEEATEFPHVIVVMNETFSDLRVGGAFELTKENLEFFYSLEENTIRGNTHVSILGGGTPNTEFEVLTGCSMGLLPRSYYPYQQCITEPIHSMVSTMKNLGYTSHAMHPERDRNWNRDIVYRNFGFEHCYWKEDFAGAETLHYGVRDLENYRKIEEIYENRAEGEKLFIFNVTIQNHGGYQETDVEQTVTAVGGASEEVNTYLSLIDASDRDFRQLIEYFEKEEERVVICMFGDHQPSFSDGTINDRGEDPTGWGETMNTYRTPFVIWANYDISEQEELEISTNYLGGLVMEAAGLPQTPYFEFLGQQREEFPVITVNGYINREVIYSDWSGSDTEFLEYRMLQYNYLFDRNRVEWGF